MYFGLVIKSVLLTQQCSDFHSIMVFFSLLCPPQQVGYGCDVKLERDTTGTQTDQRDISYIMPLHSAIKAQGKEEEDGGFGYGFHFPKQPLCVLKPCFFRNWMDIGLQTTNSEYISDLLFCLHMQQLCCFISTQGLPAFALLILSSVPLGGEWLGECLAAG